MGFGLQRLFGPERSDAERMAAFRRVMTDDHAGILTSIDKTKHAPGDLSLRELWDLRHVKIAAKLDNKDHLGLWRAMGFASEFAFAANLERSGGAINSSVFPLVVGNTLINLINKNSQEVDDPNIPLANELVTVLNDNKPETKVPEGITVKAWGEVGEGEEFPRRTASEHYVWIGRRKFGESCAVTMEAVRDDDTGLVMMMAEDVGRTHPSMIARYIIERVIDRDPTNKPVYRPKASPTGTTFYSASARTGAPNGNLKTSNGLVDETDIKAVRLILAENNDGDQAGGKKRIGAQIRMLLVPENLRDLAIKLVGQPMTASFGTETSQISTVNPYYGLTVRASFILDEVLNTSWFAGDPKKQFVRKQASPMRVERLQGQSDEQFDREIAVKVKVAEELEVGAIDTRFFVKSTA